MTRLELFRSAGCDDTTLINVYKGRRKTLNPYVAIAAAKIAGGKPIDYISPAIRQWVAIAMPMLTKKIKNG